MSTPDRSLAPVIGPAPWAAWAFGLWAPALLVFAYAWWAQAAGTPPLTPDLNTIKSLLDTLTR
jgi:hypothetical protein